MRGKRETLDYLRDILDAIESAERFAKGLDFRQFRRDEKTVFAVVRALEIVGEASKRLPAAVKRRYPSVPWREISGMRNKVVHEYFGVNLVVVWSAVQEDLPALKPTIVQMIGEAAREAEREGN